jgi:hypothetical protein
VINTHEEFFSSYELNKPEEAKLLIRIFKRMVYISIKKEFGYLKRFVTEPKIYTDILCNELEIYPTLLKFFEINPIIEKHNLINWTEFVNIFNLLIFRKNIIEKRLIFILKFLNIKSVKDLLKKSYMYQRCKDVS